jgi:hypothetical protein
MTLEPYYDRERSLYVIPGSVLLEIIATAQRDEREACATVCHKYAQTAFNSSSQNAAVELRDAIWARGQE